MEGTTERINRKCFCCGRKLIREEYVREIGKLSFKKWNDYKQILELWNDLNIEIFCCACYEFVQAKKVKIEPDFYFDGIINDRHIRILIKGSDEPYYLIAKRYLDKMLKMRKLLNMGEETIVVTC